MSTMVKPHSTNKPPHQDIARTAIKETQVLLSSLASNPTLLAELDKVDCFLEDYRDLRAKLRERQPSPKTRAIALLFATFESVIAALHPVILNITGSDAFCASITGLEKHASMLPHFFSNSQWSHFVHADCLSGFGARKSCTKLNYSIEEEVEAWRSILAGAVADFARAVSDVRYHCGIETSSLDAPSAIKQLFDSVSRNVADRGIPEKRIDDCQEREHAYILRLLEDFELGDYSLEIDYLCVSEGDVISQYFGNSTRKFNDALKKGLLLQVPDRIQPRHFRYPVFQFLTGTSYKAPSHEKFPRLRKDITTILTGTAVDFNGYAAANWFWLNGLNDSFEDPDQDFTLRWISLLGDMGLWRNDWIIKEEHLFTHLIPKGISHPMGHPLYRLCKRTFSQPFYFSTSTIMQPSSPATDIAPGKRDGTRQSKDNREVAGSDTQPKLLTSPGRFDPRMNPKGLGACYLSNDEIGAWSEILDRLPYISFDDILSRTLWICLPLEEIQPLASFLDHTVAISATRWRLASQAVATRIVESDAYVGLVYRLRSRPSSHGFTLFGNAGLPSDEDPMVAGVKWYNIPRTPESSSIPWISAYRLSASRRGGGLTFRRFPKALCEGEH